MPYHRRINEWREYQITESMTHQDIVDLINPDGYGVDVFETWTSNTGVRLLKFGWAPNVAEVSVEPNGYLRVEYNADQVAQAFTSTTVPLANDPAFIFEPEES